jgi:putative tryptophan/tyrosine transport system substrate-binding protein
VTATIPIVFAVGQEPVRLGLVASLARPGGNATGINLFATEIVAKRLGLLRQLVPKAVRVGVLLNPAEATGAETTLRQVQEAARTIGLQIHILNVRSARSYQHPRQSFEPKPPDRQVRISFTNTHVGAKSP